MTIVDKQSGRFRHSQVYVGEDDFSYASSLLTPLSIGLIVTLAISLALYGIVRAIGWVIGGFAAS